MAIVLALLSIIVISLLSPLSIMTIIVTILPLSIISIALLPSLPSPLLQMAITLLPLLVMIYFLITTEGGIKNARITSIITHNADCNDIIVIGNSVRTPPHFGDIDNIDSPPH